MNLGKIGIVGPCAAGKSTLAAGLGKHGYTARPIAQEHSYAPAMWQRISKPDLLVYLDVSFAHSMQRRKLNWTQVDFDEQVRRLAHARQHADIFIDTDPLNQDEVLQLALKLLSGFPLR